jgi:hypothetical protein
MRQRRKDRYLCLCAAVFVCTRSLPLVSSRQRQPVSRASLVYDAAEGEPGTDAPGRMETSERRREGITTSGLQQRVERRREGITTGQWVQSTYANEQNKRYYDEHYQTS